MSRPRRPYRRNMTPPPRRHGPPAHRGASEAERAAVIASQNEMSDLLGQLFEGEPTPRLNPDGIPGPATNGVQAALGRFFQTMLGDAPIEPNTLARRVQMLSEAMRAAEADPAAKEALRQRFVAAGATLRGEIGMVGTPRNGFTTPPGNPFGAPRDPALMTGPTAAPTAVPTGNPLGSAEPTVITETRPAGALGSAEPTVITDAPRPAGALGSAEPTIATSAPRTWRPV